LTKYKSYEYTAILLALKEKLDAQIASPEAGLAMTRKQGSMSLSPKNISYTCSSSLLFNAPVASFFLVFQYN
jgi:hypothetical protein